MTAHQHSPPRPAAATAALAALWAIAPLSRSAAVSALQPVPGQLAVTCWPRRPGHRSSGRGATATWMQYDYSDLYNLTHVGCGGPRESDDRPGETVPLASRPRSDWPAGPRCWKRPGRANRHALAASYHRCRAGSAKVRLQISMRSSAFHRPTPRPPSCGTPTGPPAGGTIPTGTEGLSAALRW